MGDQTPSGPLLPFAYDVREYRQGAPAGTGGADIRLSTAATISARFPVISPQGNLRAPDGNRIDEVVDGGYFENDGLATIADVAAALSKYGLDPFVIRIVNEPSETRMAAPQVNTGRPNRPDVEDRSWLDDASSIVRTLISTRTGHLDGHEAYLKSVLKTEARLFPIGVFPLERPSPDNPLCRWDIRNSAKFDQRHMKYVSMSWWMSHPVQAYLDAQLCVPVNWRKLVCELRVGRTGAECDS
jgi:hypothetical protein